MSTGFTFRTTERAAFCRGCDDVIVPNKDKVMVTYSFRNRGQHIYICQKCVQTMCALMKVHEMENKS